MKKVLLAALLSVVSTVVPVSAMAEVNINIGIALPPVIRFPGPIELVVIPDTYRYDVYVVPDIEEDIFFCRGWWWRPWQGRWYRSRYHDRGWVYYRYVPDFYYDIHPGWRAFYRNRHWQGHRWDYRRIPYSQLERDWRSWNSSRYWEKERKWDVERYQPLPPQRQQDIRRERQHEYTRRPDVQKHEQWKREQQRRPHSAGSFDQEQRRPATRSPQRQPDRRPELKGRQDHGQRQPQVRNSQGPQQRQTQGSQRERFRPQER